MRRISRMLKACRLRWILQKERVLGSCGTLGMLRSVGIVRIHMMLSIWRLGQRKVLTSVSLPHTPASTTVRWAVSRQLPI